MSDYNKTWEFLHNRNYFKNHKMYNKFEIAKPHNVEIADIQGKCVLDIGCGFGRHSAWFAQYAELVYGVEVTDKIINEAKKFMERNKINNFLVFRNNEYRDYIYNVDYVFSRYVFQHISKDQCKDYIDNIYRVLKPGGKINLQFRLGTRTEYIQNKEPRTEYKIGEIRTFLKRFEIKNLEYAHENEHVFVLGTKI